MPIDHCESDGSGHVQQVSLPVPVFPFFFIIWVPLGSNKTACWIILNFARRHHGKNGTGNILVMAVALNVLLYQ